MACLAVGTQKLIGCDLPCALWRLCQSISRTILLMPDGISDDRDGIIWALWAAVALKNDYDPDMKAESVYTAPGQSMEDWYYMCWMHSAFLRFLLAWLASPRGDNTHLEFQLLLQAVLVPCKQLLMLFRRLELNYLDRHVDSCMVGDTTVLIAHDFA